MEVIKKTHEEMKDELIKNANLFYNGYATEIDDATYDGYLKLVLADEPNFNIYEHIKYENDGVPVKHMIGDTPLQFRNFTKTADIESIDSEEKFNELSKDYYILPKFDGSSTVTYYDESGHLDKIISRGDDVTGFLNTNKLRNKVLQYRDGVRVQLGEAVVAKDKGGRAQANGCINSKYKQEDVDQLITIIPFDFYMSDGSKVPNLEVLVSDYDTFSRIRDKGEYVLHKSGDVNDGAVIPCDGIVGYVKPDSDLVNTEGETLRIIKLYFSEAKDTVLQDIEWIPAANSGIIHPTAVFDTVEIDETYVSRASLFNYQNVIDSKYYPGVALKVIKANMTIPQVSEIVNPDDTKASEYANSITCPFCGAPVQKYGNTDCVCSNPNCSWWMQFFALRIIQANPELGTDQNYEILFSDTEPNEKIGRYKSFVTKEYLDKLNDTQYKLDFIRIPRLSGGKLEYIMNCLEEGKKLNDILYECLSQAQWDYYELFSTRLDAFIKAVS